MIKKITSYATALLQAINARRQAIYASLLVVLALAAMQALPKKTLQATTDIAHIDVEILPKEQILSNRDQLLYLEALETQENKEFGQADEVLKQVENPILVGHLLARRYLETNYDSTPEELLYWLKHYADHPQAKQIKALAKQKGLESSQLPEVSAQQMLTPLEGRGHIQHLGANHLPNSWYSGLSAWKENRYAQAAEYFEHTARQKQLQKSHKAAAYYWAARSQAKQNNLFQAQALLEEAAVYPLTLYGMLASQALGKTLPVRTASPYISATLEEHPAFLRAQALVLINETEQAEEELRQLYGQIDTTQRPEILAMAGQLGLANLQIRLSRLKGLHQDELLFARYPLPQFVLQASSHINPALTLAIARQESAFYNKAHSPAGAKGLMQVIPQTARHVINHPQFASLHGDVPRHYMQSDLFTPSFSIRVGTSYLKILMDQPYINTSLVHLLAAYNAGPGNVATWSKAAKNIQDPLLYIESIPFAETRNYVVQVLAHYSVYQALLGQTSHAVYSLHHGAFPQYQG